MQPEYNSKAFGVARSVSVMCGRSLPQSTHTISQGSCHKLQIENSMCVSGGSISQHFSSFINTVLIPSLKFRNN